MFNPISHAFKKAKNENRPALLTYTVAGDSTKKQSLENREKYYFLLNKILEKLSRFYKKEIIFCVHPKVDENQIKTFFDNEKVKIMKYQTLPLKGFVLSIIQITGLMRNT